MGIAFLVGVDGLAIGQALGVVAARS